jgi:hypothetical protein
MRGWLVFDWLRKIIGVPTKRDLAKATFWENQIGLYGPICDEMLRGAVSRLRQEKINENSCPSSQTVSRETPRVNRTGKCLECGDPIKKPKAGRRPLYCKSCRGERSRKQNNKAARKYRAGKAKR